jgi:hypothetical protein
MKILNPYPPSFLLTRQMAIMRKGDLEENLELSNWKRRNGKPVFSRGAVFEDWNCEVAFLAVGKRNAKRGEATQQRALKSKLRIVPFVAAMKILPAGACLWFGSSSPESVSF